MNIINFFFWNIYIYNKSYIYINNEKHTKVNKQTKKKRINE